jgi:hypothetical protein
MGPLLARLFFGGGKLTRADADRIVAAALAGLASRPARGRARLTRRQR